jgi:hypothetical protein
MEQWQEAKKAYRKFYQKEYQKSYRNNLKRVEVLFKKEEFETLENISKSYQEKPITFIRKSCLAYIQSEAFLPMNENLEEAKMLIRKSSNNINQLVYLSHAQKNISNERFEAIISQVNQLETVVNTLYVSPKIIFKPIQLTSNLNADKNDV